MIMMTLMDDADADEVHDVNNDDDHGDRPDSDDCCGGGIDSD